MQDYPDTNGNESLKEENRWVILFFLSCTEAHAFCFFYSQGTEMGPFFLCGPVMEKLFVNYALLLI